MRPLRVAFGHLLVQDAAARRHPLDVAGGHAALVAEAVAVRDFAGQDVGDGLDAAMRVPGKSGEVVRRIFVAEVVEQQERIEFLGFAETEGALQLDAGALDGGLGFENLFDCAKRHGWTSCRYSYWMREQIFVATRFTTGNIRRNG